MALEFEPLLSMFITRGFPLYSIALIKKLWACTRVVERTLNVLVFSETKKDLINDLRKYSYEIENTENRRLFLGLDDPINRKKQK
jgi:hypothetical protein